MDQYAVMGNPIQHSFSPLIHQLFAEQTQQVLNYQAIQVPLDQLPQALNFFENHQGKGVNITLPFKSEAFHLVDRCTDRAMQARAINTIQFNEDGTWLGDNTDGVGLVTDLSINHHYVITGKRILILGAGGAVRGILGPLQKKNPFIIMVANRTLDKAEQLASEFCTLGNIQACSIEALPHQDSFDLIIHATSLSLQKESLALPETILAPETFCYDLAYGQEPTPFLNWSSQRGISFLSDGLGMLIEQAAESFYLWRGIRPDTKEIKSKLFFLNSDTFRLNAQTTFY